MRPGCWLLLSAILSVVVDVSTGAWVGSGEDQMLGSVEFGDYEQECKHKEQNQQTTILNTKLLTRLQRL